MSLTTADLGRLAEVRDQLMYGRPLDFSTSVWLADIVDGILCPPEFRLSRAQRFERNRLIHYLRSAYYPACPSDRAAARAILADAAQQRRARGPALDAKAQLLRALNQLGPLPRERQLRKILRVGTPAPY